MFSMMENYTLMHREGLERGRRRNIRFRHSKCIFQLNLTELEAQMYVS